MPNTQEWSKKHTYCTGRLAVYSFLWISNARLRRRMNLANCIVSFGPKWFILVSLSSAYNTKAQEQSKDILFALVMLPFIAVFEYPRFGLQGTPVFRISSSVWSKMGPITVTAFAIQCTLLRNSLTTYYLRWSCCRILLSLTILGLAYKTHQYSQLHCHL